MVRPADRVEAGRADGRAARRAAGISALRHARARATATVYATRCWRDRGVLVRPELLTQLDVSVGDGLLIGKSAFTIRGVIENEPGRQRRRIQPGPARASSTTTISPPPGCCRSAAVRAIRCMAARADARLADR